MVYMPQKTFKLVKYNDPIGSPELNLPRKLNFDRQINMQGIISGDKTMLIYPAVYYYAQGDCTTCDLFMIKLDPSLNDTEKAMRANIIQREEEPLISTEKDISERFIPMWQEERDSDSVKKIRLKDTSLFVIAIVEHQSKIHYDMSFRMLRYIVMVLTDYEAEQERLHKGITKTKDFKYPPVIPIIYYGGSENWTAIRNFKERVYLSDILGDYIPNFEYIVVPLCDYSNDDILAKKDELSLVMLINKLKTSDEFKSLKDIPPEYLKNLENNMEM